MLVSIVSPAGTGSGRHVDGCHAYHTPHPFELSLPCSNHEPELARERRAALRCVAVMNRAPTWHPADTKLVTSFLMCAVSAMNGHVHSPCHYLNLFKDPSHACCLQVAESAHLNVSIANCSAALLYPVPDAADPPFPATLVMPNMTTLHLGPPLYNYKALQLYILRWGIAPSIK